MIVILDMVMKCLLCGHGTDTYVSGNSKFYSCLNASCMNIWSKSLAPYMQNRLPIDVEEVRTVLINERKEAKKSKTIIGVGKVIDRMFCRDGKSIMANS